MNKPTLIARLTVTRKDAKRIIVEVHKDATFGSFYHFFEQDGLRWSTKQQTRLTTRSEGLTPWYKAYCMTPGLEVLAARFQALPNVLSVKLRIIKKRLYKKLINAPASELGAAVIRNANLMYKNHYLGIRSTRAAPVKIWMANNPQAKELVQHG